MMLRIANIEINVTDDSISAGTYRTTLDNTSINCDPYVRYAIIVGKILEVTYNNNLIKKKLCDEKYTLNILSKVYNRELAIPKLTRLGWEGEFAYILGLQHDELCQFGATIASDTSIGLSVNGGPKRVIYIPKTLSVDSRIAVFRYLTLRTPLVINGWYFVLNEPAFSDASLCSMKKCITDFESLRSMYE